MENPLLELQEYDNLVQALKSGKGPLQVTGTLDSQKVHLMYELGEASAFAWKLVVTYDDTRAKEIYDDFRSFTSQVWLYPAKDLLFYSADIHGNLMTRQRIAVLRRLMEDREGVVVTTMDGLMDHLLPLKYLREQSITVESGQVIDLDSWKERLVAMGYERMAQVDGMGQFSIRGGIVDIFPLTEEVPVRIELWDDEVDSIRTFDLESQRSVEQLESITIYPAAEVVLSGDQLAAGIRRLEKEEKTYEKALREQHKPEEAHRIHTIIEELRNGLDEGWRIGGLDAYIRYFCPDTVSFLEYFPQGESVIYLDEPARLKEKGETVELEFRESMVHRLEKGYLLPGQTGLLYPAAEVLARMQKPFAVMLTGLDQKLPGMKVNQKFSIDVKNVNSYQNSFEILIKDLTRWKKEGYRVILLSPSRTRASRLASDLREYDLRAYCPDVRETDSGNGGGDNTGSPDSGNPVAVNAAANKVRPGEILVTYGNLHRGFEYPLLKFVFITEGDMFGVEKKRKRRKKTNYQGKAIQSFTELSVGDYVVHEEHGLGIYKGIEKVERDKVIKDYIKIEYGDGGNLYLPATRLESIQKYAGAEAKKPKLNKLGGAEWNKTKTRVRGAVQEIAKDLVKLYAARQEKAGFQYGPDTVWQREFEELFPYDETDDQMDAIDAVKKDMESRKIMDRLICGDVGYGKTEVALRAAFKAVQDNKQVVYLVPTTILAQQHYNTFVQRMKDFPVRVDMLSRFCTPARQKRTLEDLRKGMVDIVIGTHRVLSKDMQFKDLGLLIIDEEQRFGVAHKEKIKHLKENVDVLTLTATPIPRTLHMSLAGIRDMSVLEEPPVDRMPIQTYVMEYNEEMVREAINRELARNGQVYYVYNRVTDIDEVAGRVQALVPDAVVTFAHGQMREHELERIMADFINGEIDVLVSTTIIETGLDIPNANTMIIHDADRMGLSQLYQLRGRVGRSNRTSYAFLMYKRDKLLREEAEKRLQAIREFTELGSGIKIAMRDLEIRGAGNVLGAEQHGHMEAVGYDLYCKMLNQAVLALKGETLEEDSYETVVECDIDAYIPGRYIKNEYQKLDIYKRISAIETEEEYMDMQDELMDRFGDIPHSVENLLKIAAIRALAHRAYVTEVVINRQEVRLTMHQKAKLQVEKIPDLVRSYKGDLKLVPGDVPSFHYVDRRNKNQDSLEMMGKAEEILKDMCGIRI
ncbi:transcription-repair coupling factor [Enterocloster clostridioformis]|uniref:transcription-repair coupling factor n=1 Tax=Enterocloster clostridioformis TaxID=1531 RepID=UPI00156E805A|nr:transcription-repair coupling factor [Enterocloster clostridioformis]MDB2142710.1 transcription-repair coupling factor [Enterocloster clostridioformis]MDB2147108.1 transcription-repair coupling factor [Enterocloster clostridioformis]NSD58038.1 transcription-repair coupling factor [Enterocloster clostridioformis]NSJ12045.1 transcription-repair coupling factor [Enterocloster clostridioformis]NSJ20883.1 transcription-repair coupling factor [Enterocloster clostridioformis]